MKPNNTTANYTKVDSTQVKMNRVRGRLRYGVRGGVPAYIYNTLNTFIREYTKTIY